MKRAQVLLRRPSAKILGDLRVGQPEESAVGKLNRADVERIGLAVLGELCAGDPVAATAVIGGVVIEALERPAESTHGRSHVLAHPLHDGLGKRAADDRGRRQRDPRFVPQPHRFEPHSVGYPAFAASDHRGQRRRDRQFGREPQPAGRRRRRLLGLGGFRRLRRPAAARRGPGPAAAAAMGLPARPPNRTRPKRKEPQGG